jgi:hypothetical protein
LRYSSIAIANTCGRLPCRAPRSPGSSKALLLRLTAAVSAIALAAACLWFGQFVVLGVITDGRFFGCGDNVPKCSPSFFDSALVFAVVGLPTITCAVAAAFGVRTAVLGRSGRPFAIATLVAIATAASMALYVLSD